MKRLSLISTSAAMAAALSMAATPAAAAELPSGSAHAYTPAYAAWDADSETVYDHRYRDYRGHGRYRNRTSVGDVLAGVLIIGTIAAVASAASKPRQERSYPYRANTNYNRSSGAARGIDGAADMCMREIERDVRVDSVDSVERSGSGWRVSGSLYNGDSFTCQIGQNGRIEDINYSESSNFRSSNDGQQDRQWSDDRYAAARNNAGQTMPDGAYSSNAPAPPAKAPAYPGGLAPGENYEDYPEYSPGQDDRYGG